MKIVITLNDRYFYYLKNLVWSIQKHSKEYTIYIIYQHLSEEKIDELKKIVPQKIVFLKFERDIRSSKEILWRYYSPEIFFRLFLHEILPKKIEKVLYLDSDTIVQSSLKELWETNLWENILGGVLDISSKIRKETKINSWVLLIDVKKYWATINATKNIDSLIRKMNDQDLLNNLFKNKILFLDESFNVQYWSSMFKNTRKKPVIIHYTGDLKPWQFWYPNLFQNKKYFKLANKKEKIWINILFFVIWLLFKLPYDFIVLVVKKYNIYIGALIFILMPQAILIKIFRLKKQ